MAKAPKILIAGNWKMNGLKADGKALAGGLARKMKTVGAKKATGGFEMLLCPPFTLLHQTADLLKGSGIKLGAQDCHVAEKGPHTGDIAPEMLKNLGCSYVIVGHSERRADHGETDAIVKAKAEAAHRAGLSAIVCVGETLSEREKGEALAVNSRRLREGLPEGARSGNTVVAYEPVWAIGTGKVAAPKQAQEVHAVIRKELIEALGEAEGIATRILYGGSMTPENAKELLAQPDIDGGLIGGASLKADDFMAIAALA